MTKTKAAGFTLIELIVVIVILGILAATALPRFVNLGVDARIASLQAARGALSSVTAMAKGKHLVSPSPPIATLFEGALITYATVVASGYPRADSGLANAAGLGSIDYTLVAAGSAATANSPATSFTEVAFIPVSVAGSPAGLTCFVKYTEPATATGSPSFTVFTSGC